MGMKSPVVKPVRKPTAAMAAIPPRTSALRFRPAPTRPLFRAQLASTGTNGIGAFVPPIRKLVFEYCEKWASSASTRAFLSQHLETLARANPHVEVVVRQRPAQEPLVRGFYCEHVTDALYRRSSQRRRVVNDRDKVICLKHFDLNGVQKKVQLVLDSSGAKIRSLKRSSVESTAEAARGIWSGMHVDEPFRI
jgi:large subunit ribosomal protein L43